MTRLRLVLPAAAALALVVAARAGELEVSPILVELTRDSRTALVTVRNAGTTPERYQVKVFDWAQDEKGQMSLSPTPDLVAFPAVLELAPGASRSVRVGTELAPPGSERSYRLFLEEMPPPQESATQNKVRVLTRIGIPIFVEPPVMAPKAELAGPTVHGHEISFSIRAAGNVRIRPTAVRLSFRDSGDHAVVEKDLNAWYVLAGGERAYTVDLDPAACPRASAAVVVVQLESGELTARAPLSATACAP